MGVNDTVEGEFESIGNGLGHNFVRNVVEADRAKIFDTVRVLHLGDEGGNCRILVF